MPAIYTHHIFGLDVLARVDLCELAQADVADNVAAHNAFLYGNQGPDPLYLQQLIPGSVRKHGVLATYMHGDKPSEILIAMQHECDESPITRAYALGFLCHYLLDRAVHALVYAETFAVCDSGHEGLSRDSAASQVHAEIETQIDQMMLTRRLGITCSQLPVDEILRSTGPVAEAVSPAYARALKSVNDMDVPADTFAVASSLYRTGLRGLVSKSGLKRHVIGEIESALRTHSYLRAVTHRDEMTLTTTWANDDHFPWPNAWGDGVIAASFDELYAKAFDDALEILPLWATTKQTIESAVLWTHNLNFEGETVA